MPGGHQVWALLLSILFLYYYFYIILYYFYISETGSLTNLKLMALTRLTAQ